MSSLCCERTKVLSYSVVENLLVEVDVRHRALSPIFTYLPPELTVRGNSSASKDVCRPRPRPPRQRPPRQHVPRQRVSRQRASRQRASRQVPQVIVTLTEADIPGALSHWKAHSVAALKRWLLCHNIKLPSSCRKRQLIQVYTQHQQHNGHDGLTVSKVGFHVSRSHPFLGASPDRWWCLWILLVTTPMDLSR